jgi:hypothetical protein
MSMPPGPEDVPNLGGSPSPEFIAAWQAEIGRRMAGAAESLTPMDEVCVAAHTLFQSALTAGFTERQAIIYAVEVVTRQQ